MKTARYVICVYSLYIYIMVTKRIYIYIIYIYIYIYIPAVRAVGIVIPGNTAEHA